MFILEDESSKIQNVDWLLQYHTTEERQSAYLDCKITIGFTVEEEELGRPCETRTHHVKLELSFCKEIMSYFPDIEKKTQKNIYFQNKYK